ncbi:MAG: DUF4199 domain-containing protein [Flavobacteriaceae bacterium]
MENSPLKTSTYALRYGLLLGLISVVFGVMIFMLEMHYQQDQKIGIVSLAINLILIILGLVAFKKANGGYISLAQALKTGLGIALIAGIIAVTYQLILVTVLDPDTIQKTIDFQMEKIRMEQPELPAETLDQIESMQRKFTSPWMMVAIGLVFSLFIGFVFSLIGGLIIKKSRPE